MIKNIKRLFLGLILIFILINPVLAANKAIDDFIKYGAIPFFEPFNTSYTPAANGTLYTNAFNNWNWISNCSAGASGVRVTSSMFFGDTVGTGGNWYAGKMYRTQEYYNINRSFNMVFCFRHWQAGTPYGHSRANISIGGSTANPSSPFETMGGLEIQTYGGDNNGQGWVKVYNNGTLLGTPYTNIARDTSYYIFIQKRGLQIGITVNTTGVKPSSPAYTYTMNNTTTLSSALILYVCGQGYSDYGVESAIWNISILLF